MTHIAIIDDESKVRSLLRSLVTDELPWASIVGEANSVQTGLQLIASQSPEIILLDVEMGDGTGFDLLAQMGNDRPQVIFITAFNHYAVKALRAGAVDFIEKPINPDELWTALHNARKKRQQEVEPTFDALFQALQTNLSGTIAVPTRRGLKHLDANHISFIKAEGAYAEIHFTNGDKPLMISRMLKEIMPPLERLVFTRPLRSFLVNIKIFQEIIRTDGGSLLMAGGEIVPFSKQYKETALKKIQGNTTFL
ncbi:MAG: LytR/AlgR family response regulator transcription factor [Salibacteraceae bacterium]